MLHQIWRNIILEYFYCVLTVGVLVKTETLMTALDTHHSILREEFFFFLKRVEIGPTVITTGNCSELGDLISMVWPSLLLLCTLHMFHMLFGVRCLFEPNHKHCIKPIAQKSFYSCRSWFMGKVLTDLKLTLKE